MGLPAPHTKSGASSLRLRVSVGTLKQLGQQLQKWWLLQCPSFRCASKKKTKNEHNLCVLSPG